MACRNPLNGAPVRSKLVLLAAAIVVAACAAATKVDMSPAAPSPDPRVGLRAGWMNAAQAAWNLRLVSAGPKPAQFTDDTNPGDFAFLNSDIAFTGHYVIQGNFHGLQVWDIAQPGHPRSSRPTSAPTRKTTSRCTATCCSRRARTSTAGSTAAPRACPIR